MAYYAGFNILFDNVNLISVPKLAFILANEVFSDRFVELSNLVESVEGLVQRLWISTRC